LRGYVAALRWLKVQPGIDSGQIFLFGHSMGGAFAPLVSRRVPLRGIIVFGTIAAPLPQYFAENEERQMRMRDRSEEHLKTELANVDEFIEGFFGDRLTPAELEARAPHLHEFLRARGGDPTHLYGRHYSFWQELDDVGLPTPWAVVDVPVLALWGEADYPASRSDHVLIADTVNNAGRTTARFVEMENIGHGFDTAASMRASMVSRMRNPVNRSIIDMTTAWMREMGALN
jgi:pimeloyl-ACP methyl ester carboxylesterase